MVGFCTDPNSIKGHSGWEESYIYDCSDDRLFASSVVAIPRDGSAGGLDLTAWDLVGFGLCRSMATSM